MKTQLLSVIRGGVYRGMLGGLTRRQFLERFWQKRPLLVRQALPDFSGVTDRAGLFRLASLRSVESRLVHRAGSRWTMVQGPQTAARLRRMPARDWTLLVQGANLHLPAADRLLRRFDFIPRARLDDVMVSYAAPGGGVGPHIDSYDVFLLQAGGSRIWRLARPRSGADRALIEDAPLKLLRRFAPDEELLLDPGDMLYLPPGWAHDGIAGTAGMTCSIGFRAPTHRELVSEFLLRQADRIAAHEAMDALYADPGLRLQRHSARIPPAMIALTHQLLRRQQFTRDDVSGFLGEYLSEPKATVAFDPPHSALTPSRFDQQLRRTGVRLDRRTLMLFEGGGIYINGVPFAPAAATVRPLRLLADARSLPPRRNSAPMLKLLHSWYVSGWLHPGCDDPAETPGRRAPDHHQSRR